jgi:hypothetical protein
VEVHVFCTQVEVLGELVTLKPIPLVLPEIGTGVKVTLIDNVTHAYEVLRTLDIVLKDTHVMERPYFQPIHLVKPINTLGKQCVDDLVVGVKHVVIGD